MVAVTAARRRPRTDFRVFEERRFSNRLNLFAIPDKRDKKVKGVMQHQQWLFDGCQSDLWIYVNTLYKQHLSSTKFCDTHIKLL